MAVNNKSDFTFNVQTMPFEKQKNSKAGSIQISNRTCLKILQDIIGKDHGDNSCNIILFDFHLKTNPPAKLFSGFLCQIFISEI